MLKDVLPPAVAEALAAGNRIEAIKRLRGITGLGLKEAKDWIDSYERGQAAPVREFDKPASPYARPGLAPGEVPSGAGPGKWLALFAVGVIAILAALYF